MPNPIPILTILFFLTSFSLLNGQKTTDAAGILELSEAEITYFNNQAQQQLADFKRYVETQNNSQRVPRKLCRTHGKVIGAECITYPAVTLNDKLRVVEKTMTLYDYFVFLEQQAQDTTSLANSCLSISESVSLEKSGRATTIGEVYGKKPNFPDDPNFVPPKGSYQVYEGKSYIRETIVMFRDNQIIREEYFREVTFEARYIALPRSGGEFGWVVYIASIYSCDKKKTKKKLDKKKSPCEIEGCDPNFKYESVNPITYLIPGAGWRHFNPQRKFSPWPLITLTVGAGIGYATINKLESDDFYENHLSDRVIATKRDNYIEANDRNHKFIIASGVAAFVWLTSDLVILIKDRKNARLFNQRFKCDNGGGGQSGQLPGMSLMELEKDYRQPISIGAAVLPEAVAGVGLRIKIPLTH